MRDLTLTVTAETSQAKRALADVDTAIAKLTADFKAGSISTEQYYNKLQTLAAATTTAKTKTTEHSAAQKDLAANKTKSVSATDALIGKLKTYLTGAAILGAIKATLDYASSLEKMATATGASVRGMQELENIAVGSSVSVQTLASAVLDLERRLATGDENATAGMKALGLSVEAFLRLPVEDRVVAIAKALQATGTETEFNTKAFGLFGRTYKEILPVLHADVDQLRTSVVILGDATVNAAARSERGFSQLWLAAKRYFALIVSRGAEGPLTISEQVRQDEAFRTGSFLPNPLPTGEALRDITLSVTGLDQAYRELDDALQSTQAHFKANEATVKKAAEAQKALKKSILEIENVLPGLRTEIGYTDDTTLESIQTTLKRAATEREFYNMIGEREIEMAGIKTATLAEQAAALRGYYNEIGVRRMEDEAAAIKANSRVKQSFVDAFANLPDLLMSAFTGGGGILGAIKAFGVQLADALVTPVLAKMSQVAKMALGLGSALASGIGGMVGGGAGAMVGGMASGLGGAALAGTALGTAAMAGSIAASLALGAATMGIGLAAVGAYYGLKKMFAGPTKEIKEARTAVGDFQKSIAATLTTSQLIEAGGEDWKATVIGVRDAYLATGRSVEDADAAVRNLWDSAERGADATKAALDPIRYALDLQRRATDTLTETTGRYQFSIEELGPALSRQRLSEQSQQLYTDWMVLTGAGIDVAAVGREMADSINAFLKAAINTGAEVDIAMKPMLQRMVDMGLLTDENGKKLKDLSGITFSETMSEGFTRIVDAVKELTDTIKRGLGLALDETSDKINKMPDVHVRVIYDDPGMPGAPSVEAPELVMGVRERAARGLHMGGMVLPFLPRAHRGLAVDEVPIIAQTGEGILNRGAMRRIGGAGTLDRLNAGGGGGGGPLTVNVHVTGAVIDNEQTQRRLADVLIARLDENVQQRRKLSAR